MLMLCYREASSFLLNRGHHKASFCVTLRRSVTQRRVPWKSSQGSRVKGSSVCGVDGKESCFYLTGKVKWLFSVDMRY